VTDHPTAPDAALPRRLLRAEQVLAARTRRVALVLEGTQDPHNVHAVLRTAEALGVQDVHVVAPRRQAAHVARGVTQGAHRWLTIRRHESMGAAARVLRAEGRSIWAACPGGDAVPLAELSRVEGRLAVLVGNETDGLSDEALAAADGRFRIDLVGFTGSLNLSVAAAITLWELRREDLAAGRPGDLRPEEVAELRADWYRQLLGRRADPELQARHWLERADEIARAAGAGERVEATNRERRGDGEQERAGSDEP